MNALFLGVAKCGGKPSIQGKEAINILLTVHQQDVPLKFLGTSDLGRNNYYRSPDDHRSAKESLSLVVPNHHRGNDVRVSWADAPDLKLETRLTEIAVELVVLAEVLHRENAVRQHEWLIERKEDNERRKSEVELARLEAIRIKSEKFEAAKRGTLLSHARDLNYAQTLRGFVDEVLKQKGDLIDVEMKAWARFVRDEADHLDPITDNRFFEVMKLRLEDFGENDA